ncbi:indolepyruvate ferredoxin oxidoreductase family protein [Kordiimonas pumila]|uniref:Indolepyruvate ferredoxin oxidoreductase family protein n=1 Tax=Kordiimonas pumila TaxID=2161677 RepID=A0ABV7D731_9PROT|nr:indolepyruvate ferredoxin oxidoreductase family protein [Kordiimonas pumila]
MPDNLPITLNDRFTAESGSVLLSGIQALVRLPMDQMRRDRKNNLNTGVFISGYRGSPLGGYDFQLTRNKKLLDSFNVRFQPGVNEELAATAVWGSQQVNLFDGATVDGVCGIWYGKTPGVDRSTDAFRHGNAAGSSRRGGVLVIAGDDHGCKSSSYPGQSEFAFVDMHMPVLNPSDVQEVLDYGIYGIELSRFSGCWTALITLTENMDSSATVDVGPDRVQIEYPKDFEMPAGGLNIRLPDAPLEQEERLWRYKRPAALAFCRANKINKVVFENPEASLGIVTAGKAHLDLMQALSDLGIDEGKLKDLGIRILKIGMTYPLDVEIIRKFSHGLDHLFVIEEKRSLIEVQMKEELYNYIVKDPHFPQILGKNDSNDKPLLSSYGELSPAVVAEALARIIPSEKMGEGMKTRLSQLLEGKRLAAEVSLKTQRAPFFCSGCPHNTSTKVPDGSRALAGIGCHYLVQTMDRNTQTFTQMGGEGVNWVGQAGFTDTPHVFVNLGDGTYFHSGVLAVRASVAAGVNVTYKILFNDAVAMTGGQPHDGELRPDMIVRQVMAEGVKKLVWVMDDTSKYQQAFTLPENVEIRHRDDMDAIQRELREHAGVTCILYDQTCATELRRKRKRGLLPDPNRRAFINSLVCEGCGDCSVQSNCISVEPKETSFGTKRQINQTSCNKDMSCVKGFCPSFVTVEGGKLRKSAGAEFDPEMVTASLPDPVLPSLDAPWNTLVTGIGGTGVVTVGALLSMAAHIEGKAVTTLDQTGLAQKGGAVYSHIRIASSAAHLHAVRIGDAGANALIACDLVAASSEASCLSKLQVNKTKVIINTDVMPTSAFVLGKNIPDENQKIISLLQQRALETNVTDAYKVTQKLLGGTTTANIFMLGYAYQRGCVPLQLSSLYQAIELNGVAVEANKKAFTAGRLAAYDSKQLAALMGDTKQKQEATLDDIIQERSAFLTDYQNSSYAGVYTQLIEKVRASEQALNPSSEVLAKTVAKYAFKLMAYKDEYEVARLLTHKSFFNDLNETFEGDYKLTFHMAPPIISRPDKKTGVAKKVHFKGWILPFLKLLAQFKVLRGTAFDIFSYTRERKQERKLIVEYQQLVDDLLDNLTAGNLDFACQIAAFPEQIRGYGHIKELNIAKIDGSWHDMIAQFKAGHEKEQRQDPAKSAVEAINRLSA